MDYNISYDLFLFEETLNQIYMEEYINECIVLSDSSHYVNELFFIQEAFKEKIKEAWDKLILAIQRAWSRFISNMTSFLKGDIEYLKKYRSVVFDNKLKEETYTMYKYWDGMSALKNDKVPAFSFSKVIKQSEDDMFKELGSKYISKDKPVPDMARYIYRGSTDEPVAIESEKIPLTEMYNYCVGYGELKTNLEKQMKEIEKAADEAIRIINSMKNTNENYIYSFFNKNTLLMEVDVKISDAKDVANAAINGPEKAAKDQEKRESKEKENAIKNAVTNSDKNIDSCKLYVRTFSAFLFAKMSIAEEAYKAYMFILKRHIEENIKNKKEKVTTTVKTDDSKSSDSESPVDNKKSGITSGVEKIKRIFKRKDKK